MTSFITDYLSEIYISFYCWLKNIRDCWKRTERGYKGFIIWQKSRKGSYLSCQKELGLKVTAGKNGFILARKVSISRSVMQSCATDLEWLVYTPGIIFLNNNKNLFLVVTPNIDSASNYKSKDKFLRLSLQLPFQQNKLHHKLSRTSSHKSRNNNNRVQKRRCLLIIPSSSLSTVLSCHIQSSFIWPISKGKI